MELQSCTYICERKYSNYWNRCTDAAADETDAAPQKADVRNKKVTLKHYGPFTDCINKTNNIQVDNAKYLDVVMLMHTLIEHTDNYTKLQKVHGSTTNMIQMKK